MSELTFDQAVNRTVNRAAAIFDEPVVVTLVAIIVGVVTGSIGLGLLLGSALHHNTGSPLFCTNRYFAVTARTNRDDPFICILQKVHFYVTMYLSFFDNLGARAFPLEVRTGLPLALRSPHKGDIS